MDDYPSKIKTILYQYIPQWYTHFHYNKISYLCNRLLLCFIEHICFSSLYIITLKMQWKWLNKLVLASAIETPLVVSLLSLKIKAKSIRYFRTLWSILGHCRNYLDSHTYRKKYYCCGQEIHFLAKYNSEDILRGGML